MRKAMLGGLLAVWVSGAVMTHVVYIKRVGWTTLVRLPPVQVLHDPRRQIMLPGALFARTGTELTPAAYHPLAQAGAYLRQHPTHRLTVTGSYTQREAVATVAPDIGRGRAESIVARLTAAGVPASQLDIRSQCEDALVFVHDSTGALGFVLDSTGPLPKPVATTLASLAVRKKQAKRRSGK